MARPETAAALAARVGQVVDDLTQLMAEVERERPFFGSFHAVNGLRRARTHARDCIYWLTPTSREVPGE